MFKKVLFISLVLAGLLLFGTIDKSLADADAQLQQAEQYVEDENYQQAETIYKTIVTDYPGTDDALEAQKGLTILYIAWGRQPEAQAAYERLLADFSGNEGIAQAVYRIADEYRRLKNYEKAREVYQYVVDSWPDSEYAMRSQKGVAISNIQLGDDGAAQAAIEKLLTEFSENKRLPEWVYRIAKEYGGRGKYEKARELYQYVLDNWPDSEYAMRSQKGVAISNIRLGDEGAAQAAIEKLLTEFSENKRLPQGFCNIAKVYGGLGKYEKAREFYQYVLDNWPDSEEATDAQVGVAISYIGLGDDSIAQAAIDKLLADFSNHPDLFRTLFVIGEEYYYRASRMKSQGLDAEARDNFTKAITMWERMMTELPADPTYTAHAYYFSADCYRQLREYQNAIAYYQNVVDNWPDYEYAWDALFRVGRSYENLKESALISESEADAKIKTAYERLLERYPACPAAEAARCWLGKK